MKAKNFNEEIRHIGEEIMDKPLGVIGTTLVDIAEVIKKKYQLVYKNVIDINKTISKGLVDSKGAAGIVRNLKKPLKDSLHGGDLNASLDKEMSDSIDRPLFQADNRDVSGSGQGVRIDGSVSGDKAKGTDNSSSKKLSEGMRFDMDGYFVEGTDNFTTEQHDHLTNNIFTQGMEAIAEKKNFIDGLSFDEIKEKLNQEFDAKVARPKKEKTYVTVDEDIVRHKTDSVDTADVSLEIPFLPEIDLDSKLFSEFGLTKYRFADFEDIVVAVGKDREEMREAAEIGEDFMNQMGFGDAGGFNEFGFDANLFEDNRLDDEDVKDHFIGDDQLDLKLANDEEEANSGIVERIIKMVPKDVGKKKAAKFYFSDVVSKLSNEKDAADVFYDLMCAARTGSITLAQSFPSELDGSSRLPVIEVSLAH